MQEYIIRIIEQDGDYLKIADTAKGYEGRIHKSLVTDNKLEFRMGVVWIKWTLPR